MASAPLAAAEAPTAPSRLLTRTPRASEGAVAVALMVSAAVGRAAGRAEAQMELEAALQQKEKELSRLRDKLQYWERMNQEMSQQNTQAIGKSDFYVQASARVGCSFCY